MALGWSSGGGRNAGACFGRSDFATDTTRRCSLQCCCILVFLACAAVVHAEEDFIRAGTAPPPPEPEHSDELVVLSHSLGALETPPRLDYQPPPGAQDAPPSLQDFANTTPAFAGSDADNDAPATTPNSYRESTAATVTPLRVRLHLDDETAATGFTDGHARSLALALDAPVPRAGGLMIQPRLEMAYRPGVSPVPDAMQSAFSGDTSLSGFVVRLYSMTPTRLHGIYPFVEADWWQDSRKQIININGTRIDSEMLRGLFSFNVGAHSNGVTGLKLWFKVRAGRNPGGTVGARYRW